MRVTSLLSVFVAFLLAWTAPVLSQCDTLLASGNAEYPPYLWRSAQDEYRLDGAVAALMERIGKEAGVEIRLIFTGPWGRTQEELAAGRIDVIAGAFFTRARSERMDYLYPAFQQTRSLVWVHEDKPFEYSGFADLRGRQGITVINNSFGQAFDDYARDNLSIHQVGSLEQGLRMLSGKRVDYVIYEEQPGLAYARKLQIPGLKTLPQPVSGEALYMTMSKKSPCNTDELKQRLQAALQKSVQEGWMVTLLEQAQQRWQDFVDTRNH